MSAPKVTQRLVCTGKDDTGRLRYETRTEWTPQPTSSVPIRSTWRDAIGAPLTNRKILQYERDGRYGPEAQAKALAEDRELTLRARERRLRKIERDREAAETERLNELLAQKYV